MDTRAAIIQLGDTLIREKGYNAFSFSDISKQLNIKNASVHYHFPTKTDLGTAIVNEHQVHLDQLIKQNEKKNPLEKLKSFLSIYTTAKNQNMVCLVGSLATDLYTVDEKVQLALQQLVNNILAWVMQILTEGKQSGIFHFEVETRTRALMIITNMLAALQVTRLTNKKDFQAIRQAIINDLTQNK